MPHAFPSLTHAARVGVWILLTCLALCSVAGAEPLPPAEIRPHDTEGPTRVSVGIWVTDIAGINSADQTFDASLFVVLAWHDPRLAHGGEGVRNYSLDDIWHPEWEVENDDGSVHQNLPERAEVTGDGHVVVRMRFVGNFEQRLNLRAFPFDQHRFRIQFMVLGLPPGDVEFVSDPTLVAAGLPQGVSLASPLTISDWRVDVPSAFSAPYLGIPGVPAAGYVFEFRATRLVQHYLVKVMIPLLLIVLMSWTVFWIDPSNGGTQISVAVTSMLTLIAYRFAIGSEVPKLPYLTRLDALILTSSLLVFFSLCEVMLTTKLAGRDHLERARRIDRICRFAFPLAFAIAIAGVLMR